MYDKLSVISQGLMRKFPEGNEPFQLMTRLLEELGELAQEVNHFEGSGVKREKYGDPDLVRLATEASHVLRGIVQVIQYYQIETEVAAALEGTYQRLKEAGFIESNGP